VCGIWIPKSDILKTLKERKRERDRERERERETAIWAEGRSVEHFATFAAIQKEVTVAR
jgi:hypothetical protein